MREKKTVVIFMSDRWDQDDLGDSRYLWLPVEFYLLPIVSLHVVYHDEWEIEVSFNLK